MRSSYRSLAASDAKTVAAVAVSIGIVGISYGATAHAAGFVWWQVVVIAAAVFGASSEFLFVGVLAAGAGPLAAVIAGLLVNLRTVAYGMSAAAYLRPGVDAVLGAHLVNDESVALAGGQKDSTSGRTMFWWAGLAMFVAWPVGAAIGALLGSVAGDPQTWGLDAVFPTLLLALLIPMMADRAIASTVVLAALIAAAATPFVPAGLGPVVALLSLPVLLAFRTRTPSALR